MYNLKADLKIFFDNNIDIEIIDYNIFNKYAIYKLNQYAVTNAKNYNPWNCIQVNSKKFKVKYFDKFYNSI